MDEYRQNNDFGIMINEQNIKIIEQLADRMPGGMFIYHADGNEELIYANNAVIKIFGCDTLEEFKELTGYTFRGMVHPDDIEKSENIIMNQIAQNEDNLDYVEYRIIRKDGSIRWIMDYGHFVHTEEFGDLFYVFIDDSTDKYLEIQEQKRKAEVIEGLARNYNAVYMLDFEVERIIPYRLQNVTVLNSGEYSRNIADYREFSDEFIDNVILPEDRENYRREIMPSVIKEKLQTVKSYSVTFKWYNDKGEVEWEQMFVVGNEGENKCTRAVISYRTITERIKKVRAETAERIRMEYELDEAKHANQAKSAFLFNMSHDIRTPMNAIAGFTRLAKKYIKDPEKLNDCLNKVEISIDHLLSLINDVLDMSLIESGQIRINTEPCNLTEQLSIVLEMLSTQVAEKGLQFSADINITEENIYADPLNLRRIFTNVIGNAVKFTPENGHVKIKVSQGVQTQAGYVSYQFVISDTGIGMSEEFMQRMFVAFEREDTSTNTGNYGTGLGLSITKNLVDMMGGSITAVSKKGEGTTFTIALAFKIANDSNMHSKGRLEDILKKWSEDRLKGKRILVVEDNELNREIAVAILTDAGFKVESVNDGCEAVDAVRDKPPMYYDVVLMDIQMPVMNGYDATKAIRALDREDLKNLPIIALSANAMSEDKNKSIESGMNAHIAKPIDIMNLMGTVGDYI